MSAQTELSTEQLIEAFEYLDELRESGQTNMFAAPAWLRSALLWDRAEAFEATKLWMKTFDPKLTVEQRIAQTRGETSSLDRGGGEQ